MSCCCCLHRPAVREAEDGFSNEQQESSDEDMEWSGTHSLFLNLSIPQLDGAADESSGEAFSAQCWHTLVSPKVFVYPSKYCNWKFQSLPRSQVSKIQHLGKQTASADIWERIACSQISEVRQETVTLYYIIFR